MDEYGVLRNVTKLATDRSREIYSEGCNALFKFVFPDFEYGPH
jgi:hypothetical protein